MTLSARTPGKCVRVLHRGRMVAVYRAVLDGLRDAQETGAPIDLEAMAGAAEEALVTLALLGGGVRLRRAP